VTLAIGILSVGLPGDARPPTLLSAGQLEHMLAYFVAALLFGVGYPKHLPRVVVLLILYAGVLETCQFVVPGRHPKVSDFLSGAAGACIGVTIIYVALRSLIRRPRSRF
jgi:VanZ family protein